MKILYVSTLKRHLSRNQFASRERIIYQLASGMVERGHEVGILGTGDSAVEGAHYA
jgi:thioredoxin reductase